jgi:hypothetical protein
MLEPQRAQMDKSPGSRSLALLVLPELLVLAELGCQPDYPLGPTPCDDWCLATQRANCEEDYPERCVSACEEDWRVVRAGCEKQWRTLTDCYLQAPAEGFLCVQKQSRPGPVCISERVALAACSSAETSTCVASCLRQAQECGRPRRNCELECQLATPGCSEPAIALYQCRLASPVDCVRPGEPDPRPPEEIPCFAEALTLLDCADFPASPAPPPPL